MKKTTLLSSVAFAVTLLPSTSMATDSHSLAEYKKNSPNLLMETSLTTTNGETECVKFNDSTESTWNSGEICLISAIDTSSTDSLGNTNPRRVPNLNESSIAIGKAQTLGAKCVSEGGSIAANENNGGFCIASDINTSETNFANLAFADDISVAGLQFLQATFGDGSTQSARASISSECISAGGSISTAENAEGFCLASDLNRSITDFANFSVANGLPLVGLQFIQIIFSDSESLPSTGTDTKCVSIDGSTATTGTSGGFCLASDISTALTESANFSVAYDVTVTNLQLLQITFEATGASKKRIISPKASPLPPLLGAGAPTGAECISIEGSIAAIGRPSGSCLISDLIGSSSSTANIAFANVFPISSLQFFQATFGDSGSTPSPSTGEPSVTKCISPDGSTAATGNAKGFCLVSDITNPTSSSANFSIANALPITTWEFLQVPSETGSPVGVFVSNSVAVPFDLRSSSDLAEMVGSQTPYFHLSNQTSEMEIISIPYWHLYPHIGLWVGL